MLALGVAYLGDESIGRGVVMTITVGVMMSSTIPDPTELHSSSSSLLHPASFPEYMMSSVADWCGVTC